MPADRETLEAALADGRVETSAPRPGVGLYVLDLGLAFARWVAGIAESFLPGFARLLGPLTELAFKVLFAVLGLALLALLLRAAWRLWRQRTPEEPVLRPVAMPDGTPAASADRWAAEIRRHLEARDVTAAVEALWWWLATALLASGVERSWTSRELVAHAGRRDLLPQIRRLDRMIYGAAAPSGDDVRRLWSDLEEALP